MGTVKIIFGTLFLIVVAGLLSFYWLFPFSPSQFTARGPIDSNFSLSNATEVQMQFYPNMRYPSPNISYTLDTSACSLQRQQDIKTAMSLLENETVLRFYSADSNPEINISCSNNIVVNKNYFVAGEGGPVNITETQDFNVITKGEVLLLRGNTCPFPNVALHELLHSLGFAHSQNPNNVMYPVTGCDQTLGQDIPDLINKLYSVPSLPDLSFENASAIMQGRYLDATVNIINNGLQPSGASTLVISADNATLREEPLKPIGIGEGMTLVFQNIWVPNLNVNEVEFSLKTNFSEIQSGNNEIRLELNP